MLEATTIQQIDFLPAELRRARRVRRRRQALVLASVTMLLLLCAVTVVQGMRIHRLHGQANSWQKKREAAESQAAELVATQQRLRTLQQKADLVARLRCRWSRSRLLESLLAAVPEGIALNEVALKVEQTQQSQGGEALARRLLEQAPEDAAEAELEMFRRQWEETWLRVRVAGQTTWTEQLNGFLEALRQVPLFSKVELRLLEANERRTGTGSQFTLSIDVVPEYGRKGAPRGFAEDEPAINLWAHVNEQGELRIEAGTNLSDGETVLVEVFPHDVGTVIAGETKQMTPLAAWQATVRDGRIDTALALRRIVQHAPEQQQTAALARNGEPWSFRVRLTADAAVKGGAEGSKATLGEPQPLRVEQRVVVPRSATFRAARGTTAQPGILTEWNPAAHAVHTPPLRLAGNSVED